VLAPTYGGPEVLAIQDIVLPAPGDGQVLVDVCAAGTNPIDYKLYSGAMGDDPAALPMPVGMEVAGVVAATGDARQFWDDIEAVLVSHRLHHDPRPQPRQARPVAASLGRKVAGGVADALVEKLMERAAKPPKASSVNQ